MDIVSYSEASTANGRIESFIENPDSTSGIVTVPKTIASGETITIPAGRVAVLPNLVVDGTLNIDGEVFIPSGATFDDLDTQIALKADTSYVNTQLGLKANTADLKEIGVGQTWQSFTVGTQRIVGTTYTNSTGRPIQIAITISAVSTDTFITIGGVSNVFYGSRTSGNNCTLSPIIPNGLSYVVTGSVASWFELR